MITQWIEEYLSAKIAERRSPATITTYRIRLGRFGTWVLEQPNQVLTRALLRAYSAYLAQQNISITSHYSYLNDALVLVRWLAEEGYIQPVKTDKLKPRLPKRLPAHYTMDQIKRLLLVAELREKAMLCVLLDTGVRVSELIQLRRTSFDSEGCAMILGKGSKDRYIWISSVTQEVLRTYIASRTDTNPALFVSHRQQKTLTISGVHQSFDRVASDAEIRNDVRRLIHSFRATFARELIKKGLDAESLRVLMGHETIQMSLHYAQLSSHEATQNRQGVNLLEKVESCL
ncbi:MAG TPA: hypothetical protein DEF47_11310 [Herpetosiphon sp.]|uniref:Integrase family protein n=1 Tax=Herpetosiphon aurantiacus (strain ATCC 23779 / DSM 785 / 114-95) TaxID=316274 RepID=A9AWS6_HERA2|nr:tyrosine-type recombinase/integrase [Herpetosiphon sp.]ABX03327.1 integrase family protein [Herpetosiphon aurantiacus DSM 785]HBW50482.1 hypothetical protein [Herpetosiphon sp.]